MRRANQLPVDPYHVASAFINGNVRCECGEPAAYKGWFTNYTGSGRPIINAMLLCTNCAKQVDKDVELLSLTEIPAWERI